MTAVVLRETNTTTRAYLPRRGLKREVTLRRFDVLMDGQKIGEVERAMLPREQRTPGRVYVNARWTSPGWQYRELTGRALECYSRRDGIERLVRQQPGMDWRQAEAAAKAARVER